MRQPLEACRLYLATLISQMPDPMTKKNEHTFAIGARVSTRGEDFLINNITINEYDHSYIIDARGISELVKGKQFKFDSRIDTDIQLLAPANTRLVADVD